VPVESQRKLVLSAWNLAPTRHQASLAPAACLRLQGACYSCLLRLL